MAASEQTEQAIRTGILTVSDTCFQGTANDRSGDNLKNLLESGRLFPAQVVTKDIVPDEQEAIKLKLCAWSDNLKLDLILTTGGTGFSARDVTPEATKSVLDREAVGMTVAMLSASLTITPLAMLSRAVRLPPLCSLGKEVRPLIPLLVPSTPTTTTTTTIPMATVRDLLLTIIIPTVSVDHHSHSQVSTSEVARRARESPYPLVQVDKALTTVLQHALALPAVSVKLADALGYYLAEDVHAADPLPPFPASIKDGYAVIAADGAGLRKVMGESCAGDVTVMSGDENSDSGESDSDSTGSVVDENVTLDDSLRAPPAVVDDVDIAEDVTTEQFVEFLMTDWHDDFPATHRDEESGLHIDHMDSHAPLDFFNVGRSMHIDKVQSQC
ncbi:hypothetical protein ACOMHN_048813 [Nucella lapillus]